MKGPEHFTPGTGSAAVAAHLHQVLDHARTDLRRAPEHQRLLARNIAHWLDAAHGPLRKALDRAGPTMALHQFAALPAPSSVTGLADADRLYRDLVEHGWLQVAAGTGTRRHYRTHIGDPFGIAQPATTRPARR